MKRLVKDISACFVCSILPAIIIGMILGTIATLLFYLDDIHHHLIQELKENSRSILELIPAEEDDPALQPTPAIQSVPGCGSGIDGPYRVKQ